jgi:1,4-dihydroxy-2-naphthoyl-CoA hydrolase
MGRRAETIDSMEPLRFGERRSSASGATARVLVPVWDGWIIIGSRTMFHFDKKDLKALQPGRFRYEMTVRFQDVDAAGIVFFPRVLEYMHDAYVAALAEIGSELHAVLRSRAWAAPLRHAEADYFSPLRFGDRLVVSIVAAHLASTEIVLGYQVAHLRDGAVAAVGQTVHTFVDPKTFERIPVPENIAEALRLI